MGDGAQAVPQDEGDDVEGMARAIPRIAEIDPARCRARAIERFGLGRMVRDYATLYEHVRGRRRTVPVANAHAAPAA